MKKLFPVLLLVLILLSACNKTATTTTAGTDSTQTADADTTTPVLPDSSAVADVPPAPADSPAAVVSDPNASTAENGKKVNPDPIVTATRLTVSFISIGAGIDFKTKEKFVKFVAGFETRNKVKLVAETVAWGREGELDFCYDLATLKPQLRATFVQEAKALVNGNDLVLTKENTPCRKPRNG
ncbi:MAG: hypothetical protein RLZZ519_706 [Bacteroidota bacterium]|jgi:hypothetical protein